MGFASLNPSRVRSLKEGSLPDDHRVARRLSLRLPSDLIEAFDQLAAALDRSRSWVMVRALRHYREGGGRARRRKMTTTPRAATASLASSIRYTARLCWRRTYRLPRRRNGY